MFIRKAVQSLGAVYKLFSHGAVREGSAVGRFMLGFSQGLCDAVYQPTHSLY